MSLAENLDSPADTEWTDTRRPTCVRNGRRLAIRLDAGMSAYVATVDGQDIGIRKRTLEQAKVAAEYRARNPAANDSPESSRRGRASTSAADPNSTPQQPTDSTPEKSPNAGRHSRGRVPTAESGSRHGPDGCTSRTCLLCDVVAPAGETP